MLNNNSFDPEDSNRLDWLTNAHLSAEEYVDLIECYRWAGRYYPGIRAAIDAARGSTI